jgi:hypothetical protein
MVNLTYPEIKETEVAELPPASLDTLKQMREDACSSTSFAFKLQPQQRFLRRVLSPDAPTQNILLVHGTGVGKCHGIDTEILMFDGSVKKIQDVVVGDLLMGDDSTPRSVLSLARGRDTMFEIRAIKGDSYTVNSEHILSLKYTGTDKVIDVPLDEYLRFSNKRKHILKGYATGVEFPHIDVSFDPYMLGVWLGDGSKRDPLISSQDSTILHYMRNFAHMNNLSMNFQSGYEYRFSAFKRNEENVFLTFLKRNNLIHNKHVPTTYKINSREVRLQVLAGLIDTDGHLSSGSYDIIQKSKQLSDDIIFLARSLGFSTTTKRVIKTCTYKGEKVGGYYYRTMISGDICEIPVKIPRKKAAVRMQKKDVLKYGFQVIELGEGDYYGFVLDGNHRYVLGNFTVTHNTCSAIQVAEEYILRPEFQDKKVLVLANPSIQENFKNQIFDVSRVNLDVDGLLTSKQCTGRRYLDILQRGQHQPLKVSTREQQETLMSRASKIINEFYEFQGYGEFANILEKQKIRNTPNDVKSWIHATFDNRLLIVDEAHNLRETTETNVDVKLISAALKQIIQVANGITLVLLTATPMYDRFEEIFDYFNMFLWNSRKQAPSESIHADKFFTDKGDFVSAEAETHFRSLCETYVSFVKGENPFTFPFRLPPPDSILAKNDRKLDLNGKAITTRLKYLPLTQSIMSPHQANIVKDLKLRGLSEYRTICTFPENKSIGEVLDKREGQYFYTGEQFLAPSKVATYSSKFALITDILANTDGVAFVYSNLAEVGVQLFAMCLEEHGYTPASGNSLLGETSGESKKGSKGKYALITSQNTDAEINRILTRLRRRENMNGEDIRVVLASPKVSEGVDFRYVRQIHILDPWFNMSRIEQVIGRGMRVCSHSLLPFEQQNTTVYLHVCRYADKKQETLDEHIYRVIVEQKGIAIAKVKKILMESAIDCSLEHSVNSLPADWQNLPVPQIRNQDKEELQLPIAAMTSPAFIENTAFVCKIEPSKEDKKHMRPLSAILDVRDEILDKLLYMFVRKPIWTFKDLYESKEMKQYEQDLVSYILQNAVESRVVLKDSYGRSGHLEAKKGLITFSIRENETLQDKTLMQKTGVAVPIKTEVEEEEEVEEEVEIEKPEFDLEKRIRDYKWPAFINEFSEDVKQWYFVDQILNKADKVKHILSLDRSKNPIYVKPIRTPSLTIFSPEEIYNSSYEKITPIGSEKDEYDAWRKSLKDKFLGQRDAFFGSIKAKDEDKKLIFNVDEKALPVKKVERSKGIGGRTCIVYPPAVLDSFMEWLGGSFPPAAKNRELKCVYLDLMIRKAVLDEKEGVVWYTPEEWTILDEMKKTLK